MLIQPAMGTARLAHAALGAQVLQAHLGSGTNIFYLSPSPAIGAMPVRGGVPVLFPQFADSGPLPKHGMARAVTWKLAQEAASNQTHKVTYELAIAPGQFADWPHTAHLSLQAEASQDGVHLHLQVTNTGASAFSWTGGLHPYFAVDDLQACTVTGLAGLAVQDRYDSTLKVQPDGPPVWGILPFERLYDACPVLTISTGRQRLELLASGFNQWMVWNPGEAGGAALADLPPGDWRRFVCLEPVCVSRPVSLLPGETFAGTLDVRLLPDTSEPVEIA